MVDILVQGGDAEAAAKVMRAAVREIFETDPIQSAATGPVPGTRGLAELGLIILAIPPGVVYAKKMIDDFRLRERWRRLIARAEQEENATGARLLIDPGDGKPIPLHQANADKIREALAAFQERYSKS
jgi:hypothetical protein